MFSINTSTSTKQGARNHVDKRRGGDYGEPQESEQVSETAGVVDLTRVCLIQHVSDPPNSIYFREKSYVLKRFASHSHGLHPLK